MDDFVHLLASCTAGDSEWESIVERLSANAHRGGEVEELAADLGLKGGISGYVYHTVPVAAYAWFRHFGDFRTSLESVLGCGGDTDTW